MLAMQHIVLHAYADTLLFHNWTEARALWDRFVAIGSLHALVLMPDHLHLLAREPAPLRIRQAMAAWTRWRCRERGWKGPVWLPLPEPETIPDRLHLERTLRYIHLNPCRGELVSDPLAWPMSTHRDALGLAVPLVRPMEPDPFRFHAYVSGDPTVNPSGTAPPTGIVSRKPAFEDVERAVSAVTRTPLGSLRERSPTRDFLVRALRVLTDLPTREIGKRVGLSHTAIRRIPRESALDVATVDSVMGDDRFRALNDADLRHDARVRRYLRHQSEKRLRKPA